MRYMLQVVETPEEFAARTDEDAQRYWASYSAYSDALAKAGASAGGAALKAPDTAKTVRVRDGARRVEDGPYADVKEQLGGFFLIEAPDLDAALDWAARCPSATRGAVEVRPMPMIGNDGAERDESASPTHCLLLYDDEGFHALTPAQQQAEMGRYVSYSEALAKAGVFVHAAPLESIEAATTVRLRDGARQVEDGPYLDSKERLGGFYLIKVARDEDALEWAARCPSAEHGVVEIRPKLEISAAGVPA